VVAVAEMLHGRRLATAANPEPDLKQSVGSSARGLSRRVQFVQYVVAEPRQASPRVL
jgi:hypothetical protein